VRNQRIGTRRSTAARASIGTAGRAARKHTSLPVPERLAHLELELLSLKLLLVHLWCSLRCSLLLRRCAGCCGYKRIRGNDGSAHDPRVTAQPPH
jgi:hypothetical protein